MMLGPLPMPAERRTARGTAAGGGRRASTTQKPGAPDTGPRAVAREARESLYREHILAAAEAVFAADGFETAKVQDISRRAGLSMGSIYSLFPGKDQLFQALVERRGSELLGIATDVVERIEDPAAALDALVEAYVGWFHAHPEFLRMHIRTGASWPLEPDVDDDRRALSRRIHDLQARIFERGVAQGVFVEEDPAWLSVVFSGIDQAHLAHWVAGGMKDSREKLVARLAGIVRRAFLR